MMEKARPEDTQRDRPRDREARDAPPRPFLAAFSVLTAFSLLGTGPALSAPKQGAAAPSSCLDCHGRLEGAQGEPVRAWPADVHGAAGLGCESCHGGDPSPALADDPEAAMSAAKGFRPAPDRLRVAGFCARCHADATFMKQYNPQARVDQLAEYQTSVHGRLNKKGDPNPATCTDCHGVHGIRPVSSPDSPVYATNVPKTCSRCHSDTTKMASYGIPTSQYADYRQSVHAAALLDRGDTAAPACNDCHGNHGAAPPGVQSVAHVCGQCHGREATLFEASFKKELFSRIGAAECTICHDHHRIYHPTPELFHGASEPRVTSGSVTGTDPFSADLGDLASGQKVSATWRVVLSPHVQPGEAALPHTVEVSAQGIAPLRLDASLQPGEASLTPAVRRSPSQALVASLGVEPLSGLRAEPGDTIQLRLEVEAGPGSGARGVKVRDLPGQGIYPMRGSACLACHSPGDACDKATERMYGALTSLDRELRESASRLREAEIAGMEVSTPKFDLKSKGTTAAVESRALIHSFDPDRLVKRTEEGRKVAASAHAAADAALDELQYRRKGLAVSLVLIAMVLVALALKIRQVDRARVEETP